MGCSRQEQLNLIAVMISSGSKSLSGSNWEAEGTASPDIDPDSDPDPDFDFDTVKPQPLIQNDLRDPVLRSASEGALVTQV
jgi:hypothetical protein